MKRILLDINSIVPYLVSGKTNGVGRTTLELVEALSVLKDKMPFDISLYSQNMKGIGGKQLNGPFHARHFYIPNRELYNKILGAFPIKESLAPYDLMHIPHNFGYVYSPEKTIVTLHDALFMKLQEKAFNHELMRKQVPPLMNKCKGIITCSEASKKDIVETMQIDPEKIDVVYWGVKHELFYPLKDKEKAKKEIEKKFAIAKSYFFSVSCNAERKNTHKLVAAYLKLCKQQPVNDLVLVWPNPPEFVIEMIEKSGFKNSIHLLSNINDIELVLLYNGATAMVFPSSYEGFGLPILEAMACGCPVVTCTNSSLKEVGGDAAIYLKTTETEEICSVLEQCENNDFDFKEISKKGLEQASKFKWKNTALKYFSIYNKHLYIN
jgi:glycosyltransferase involved in cell wall biosynthesis